MPSPKRKGNHEHESDRDLRIRVSGDPGLHFGVLVNTMDLESAYRQFQVAMENAKQVTDEAWELLEKLRKEHQADIERFETNLRLSMRSEGSLRGGSPAARVERHQYNLKENL